MLIWQAYEVRHHALNVADLRLTVLVVRHC
jgi:hypothetical protein